MAGLFNFPGAMTGSPNNPGYYGGDAAHPFTSGFETPGAPSVAQLNAPAPVQAPNANPYSPQVASSYMQGLTNQFNQANAANKAQLNQMMGVANGYGQGQIAASDQLGQQQQAQGQQTMASRGLYNSTVAQGLNNSIQGQTAVRDAGIHDQMAQLQLGVLGQNQIKGPDLGAYAQLASQPGAFSGNNGVSALMGAMSKLNYGGATVAPAK